MKYYVIKTSNDKYLSYKWESNWDGETFGDEGCYMLNEVDINECNIFTEEEIMSFIEEWNSGYVNYSPLIYEYNEFKLSNVEEVMTTPVTLKNLEL